MDKIDGRRLKPEGREQLRRMVIRLRQQSGLVCAQLAEIAGVHVRTIEIWLKRAAQEAPLQGPEQVAVAPISSPL